MTTLYCVYSEFTTAERAGELWHYCTCYTRHDAEAAASHMAGLTDRVMHVCTEDEERWLGVQRY